eukprot:m.339850 g.339850  ORF g.339850 m.339850 type:complete len:823 (+) comp19004_c0_seq1:14-2482(+)
MAVSVSVVFLLLLLPSLIASQKECKIGDASLFTKTWVIAYNKTSSNGTSLLLTLNDATVLNSTSFNISISHIHSTRNGGFYPGTIYPNRTVDLAMYGEDQDNVTCVGTIAEDCLSIQWSGKGCIGAMSWCAAWSHDCQSPPPPYGYGLSFWSSLGDNMVLQQAPSKSAVYGVATPTATSVVVTVINHDEGDSSYTVNATFNTTHQPFGPEFVNTKCEKCVFPGPFTSWKIFLKPAQVGGNYTIIAKCTGCSQSGNFDVVNITNITFGDVWHCSGQSNMYLPVFNTFHRNETLRNITELGKYHNIRAMFGRSGDGYSVLTNPWKTALQAATQLEAPQSHQQKTDTPYLFQLGAACWYFAQKLTDEMIAAGMTPPPMGLTNSAVGGQRIEEFMRNDSSINVCAAKDDFSQNWKLPDGRPDSVMFGTQTLPFVDMTIKGWVWYQGENNMGGVKGNSLANVGYSCSMRELVKAWRKIWSETPNTTDPLAPFGIVTLASSGSEGGPNMGAMRQAQTAGYGIVPNEALPNTFLAQAYDLDDPWGPSAGPCFKPWACCETHATYNKTTCLNGTKGHPEICDLACATDVNTDIYMGGIHPRSKKWVGDRLGKAAFNFLYPEGKSAYTGPTFNGCKVDDTDKTLIITFNETLLRGDTISVNSNFPTYIPQSGRKQATGGSQLYVQINASQFCMEPLQMGNLSDGKPLPNTIFCPTWAGGPDPYPKDGLVLACSKCETDYDADSSWIMLNFTQVPGKNAIAVDLRPLNGSQPTAVRYAWGIINCCDYADPNLFVTHGCIENCPIMSTSGMTANPFMAKIQGGVCECLPPMQC